MPNHDKSSQAANNSTCTASVLEWKTLYRRELNKAQFSDNPELYQITIDGEHWDSSINSRVRVSITDLFSERHPYMAIGRAVIAFMEASAQSRVHRISIAKQVEKRIKVRTTEETD